MKTTISIVLLAGSLCAQTNSVLDVSRALQDSSTNANSTNTNLTFDVLHTRQGDFTNATITSTNPACVGISHQKGATTIAITNLPPALQEQLGYDPTKANAFLEAQKQHADASRRAMIEQQKNFTAAAGPVQNIRVIAILDGYGLCRIQTTNGMVKAYVLALPGSVIDYWTTRANLEARIHSLSKAPIIARGSSGSGTRASLRAAEDAHAEAVRQRNAELADLRGQLADLKKQELQSTTVPAYPTKINDAGTRRWQAMQ